MSRAHRLPVVFARRAAIDQATSAIPGRVLENAVREQIVAGRMTGLQRDGHARVHGDRADGAQWVASVIPGRSPMTRRRTWVVTEVDIVDARNPPVIERTCH